MELIDRARKKYGIPATLLAHEPEWDLRASYDSPRKDMDHEFRVKNQVIERTSITKNERGNSYRLCLFNRLPQWVNEENIRQRRLFKAA